MMVKVRGIANSEAVSEAAGAGAGAIELIFVEEARKVSAAANESGRPG